MASSVPTFMLPTPQQDPYARAVADAKQQYPWVSKIPVPIKMFAGKGPYSSESYGPTEGNNPYPGNFTVELRKPQLIQNPSEWPALLGRESIDYLARHDDVVKQAAAAFIKSMTPQQLARSRERWMLGKKEDPTDKSTFEDFLREAEAQEYLGGYLLNMKGWENAGWSPEQRALLARLKAYLVVDNANTPLGRAWQSRGLH